MLDVICPKRLDEFSPVWRDGGLGGACTEILYDRIKTAVIGEDAAGVITANESLVALRAHYGSAPRACQPYRAKTKGKVEPPSAMCGRTFSSAAVSTTWTI